MGKKKESLTFQQALDKHWYRMPPAMRQALRNACDNPACQVAKAWAERCVLAFALAPTEEQPGTAARDRMARAIINNRDLPSVRGLVLRRVV